MKQIATIKEDNKINNFDIKRVCARTIIWQDDKLVLVYTSSFKDYTFPGGGVENNETVEEAAIRETKEEVGLKVNLLSEFGQITEYFYDDKNRKVKYVSKYFLANVLEEGEISLLSYEEDLGYKKAIISPKEAYKANREKLLREPNNTVLKRANTILKMLGGF